MRYTTIIDISEIPLIYRNPNARLLYLHLALKSGYHDDDRDLVNISIRRLAMETGLTLSATRHALQQLEACQLLQRQGAAWIVKKWIGEQTITARPKTEKKRREMEEARRREAADREERERSQEEKRREKELRKTGKTSFMLYYESQLELAAQGDAQAIENVKRNRKFYEQQKQQIEKENENV